MDTLKIIFVVLLILLIWLVFRYTYIMKKFHFVCPLCEHKFKPKVYKLVFSMNAVNGKVLRCPNCGAATYMEPERD